MGLLEVTLDKQKVIDFLEECCDGTFLGDILKAGDVHVCSIEAHIGVPMLDDHLQHEIEVKVLLSVRRKPSQSPKFERFPLDEYDVY